MKKNRIRVLGSVIGGVALMGLLAGVFWGIPAVIDANRPTAVTPAEVAEPAPVYLIPDYRHPTPTPEPVVEVVEEVYVEEETYVEEAPYSNSGSEVPFIPSDDPNNASGGDYIDPGSYCTSGSASGYPPICD